MYGNYITIHQRSLIAQQAEENISRIELISGLKEAITQKDQFMSLMSHELRTPLNGKTQEPAGRSKLLGSASMND